MRTAEDIIRHHGVHARWDDEHGEAIEHTSLNAKDIQQIQLDAMKEGMRRAASMCRNHALDYEQEQSILTTAEQLTEKDL